MRFASFVSSGHWESVGVGASLKDAGPSQSRLQHHGGFLNGVKALQASLNDEQMRRQQFQREKLKSDLEQQVYRKE